MNRLVNTNQLEINPERITQLNAEFPEASPSQQSDHRAGYAGDSGIHGTGVAGIDAGGECSLPGVFRLQSMDSVENIQAPILAPRSDFPNEASFLNALSQVGSVYPYVERRTLFRFSVGRTF